MRHKPPCYQSPVSTHYGSINQVPLSGRTSWQQQLKSLARPGFEPATPLGRMGSLVQSNIVFPQFKNDLPPIDTGGGTIVDMHEEEEIDPADGCKVQVITYKIQSADGTEELTKTIRRKIKVDCMQTARRMELCNGRETKIEEKTSRYTSDITGMQQQMPMISTNNRLQLDANNPQDMAIRNVLDKTRDTFLNMVSKEKDQWVQMFPELFSKMRTQSQLIPSTTTETIVNPDGSVTTRMRSSKSMSSRFSHQETYVNGVKQMSKSKFRAFVEYKGPEGGFKVKLSDQAEDDLSEEENEDDENSSSTCYSDDNISLQTITSVPRHPTIKPKPELKKKADKAWHAAKELVDSEQRYVEKLRLLDEVFRQRCVKESGLDKDKVIPKLFANVESLYAYHNGHLLPQLMEANREWHTTKRMSHVMQKLAPFLKMYSEYTNNYKNAIKVYDEQKGKNKKFAQIVSEIERMPECENLPLESHLICPVQRVMRYQLLLQEYKKHLDPTDADYPDTEQALSKVLDAAVHANEMMRKLDRYGKVIEIQEQLGNSIPLVSPGREFIKGGPIQKISSGTGRTEDRFIFLFNDLILLGVKGMVSKYRLRARFEALHTKICEGDNLEREHSFYLRGSYGGEPARCVELFAETQKEKTDWMDAIGQVIEDARANCASFSQQGSKRGSLSEPNKKDSKNCAECDAELGFLVRKIRIFQIRCAKCHRKLCKKCFGRYKSEAKEGKLCETCVKNTVNTDALRSVTAMRRNILAVSPKGKGVLHASRVKFKGSLGKVFERYFVVRNDFCLYSYVSENESSAVSMLPLPGSEVKMCGERNTFQLRVSRRLYTITVEDEQTQAKWMAVLDLAANAQFSQSDSE